MGNPDDTEPRPCGTPGREQIEHDTRNHGQRCHDAFVAVGRNALMSGELGTHNGLPVTVIVSTTVQDLESAAGQAVTGGGSLLPMRDLIRMAAHARRYLAVYDQHTQVPLYLGRSRRLASVGQRIVLHSRDRGCTKPGWTARIHRGTAEWTPPPELDTGQARINHHPRPHRLLAPDDDEETA